MKTFYFFLISVLLTYCTTAQVVGYRHFAKIDTILAKGMHNIQITPSIAAHLKADYSDVRIINYDHRWVPLTITNSGNDSNPFVTAQLQAGNTYWLLMDNPTPEKAYYNPEKSESTYINFPFLKTGDIKLYPHMQVAATAPANYMWVTWVALFFILLVLALFAKKLLAENKKKHHDPL